MPYLAKQCTYGELCWVATEQK